MNICHIKTSLKILWYVTMSQAIKTNFIEWKQLFCLNSLKTKVLRVFILELRSFSNTYQFLINQNLPSYITTFVGIKVKYSSAIESVFVVPHFSWCIKYSTSYVLPITAPNSRFHKLTFYDGEITFPWVAGFCSPKQRYESLSFTSQLYYTHRAPSENFSIFDASHKEDATC